MHHWFSRWKGKNRFEKCCKDYASLLCPLHWKENGLGKNQKDYASLLCPKEERLAKCIKKIQRHWTLLSLLGSCWISVIFLPRILLQELCQYPILSWTREKLLQGGIPLILSTHVRLGGKTICTFIWSTSSLQLSSSPREERDLIPLRGWG